MLSSKKVAVSTLFGRIVRVGDSRLGILREPLVRARGALLELPLVLEEVLEEVVGPFRRRLRP